MKTNLKNLRKVTDYSPGWVIVLISLSLGLGTMIGWKRIDVPGTTGYLDTDYAAKGRYAVDALKSFDLVCVHIEAPDEAAVREVTPSLLKIVRR